MKIYNKILPSLSVRLNIARAGAAFLVAVSHIRGAFFAEWSQLTDSSHTVINYLLFFITRLGHEAVIIFFVLSGYLVGGSLLADHANCKPNWLKYFVNRLVRMWMVLIPALIIGAICDYYTITLNPHNPGAEHFTFTAFLGNLFFLQTIFVPTFGTNGPLWSLANEFWYYMFWPLIIIILKFNRLKGFRFILLLSVIFVLYHFIPNIILLFPIWIAGALLRYCNLNKLLKSRIGLFLAYLLFICSIGYVNIHPSLYGDYVLAISVLLIILYWQQEITILKNINNKIPHFFSEFSFSLYAIHYFIMFLFFAIARTFFDLGGRRIEANITNWFFMISICILILCFSWIFYFFTERHTLAMRKKIYGWLT